MADLCNWTKLQCLNKTFFERYSHAVAKIEWVLWFQGWVHFLGGGGGGGEGRT